MTRKNENINLKSFDDLFNPELKKPQEEGERVQRIKLTELHPFKNHPFKVREDEEMEKTVESVKQYGNAITSFPAYETVMIAQDDNVVNDVTIREHTYLGQAPQSFYLDDIIAAHDQIRKRPEGYKDMVDAATIVRTIGGKTHLVRGNRGNIKITTPEDVYTFRAFLQYREDKETFGLEL